MSKKVMLKLNDVPDIVKLIYLVKNRPAIYDTNLTDHTCRQTVDRLWQEVADELKATTEDCKRKWSSLRNAFSREMRHEKNSNSTVPKKKKWYLVEHLSFLRSFHTTRTKFKSGLLKKGSFNSDDSTTQDFDCDMEENKRFFDFSFQDQPNDHSNKNQTKKEIVDTDDDDVIEVIDDDDIQSQLGNTPLPVASPLVAEVPTVSPHPDPAAAPTLPPHVTTMPTLMSHGAPMSVPSSYSTATAILPTHTPAMSTTPSQNSAITVPPPQATPISISSVQNFAMVIPPIHSSVISAPPLHTPSLPISSSQNVSMSITPQQSAFDCFENRVSTPINACETRASVHANESNNTSSFSNLRRSRVDGPAALDNRNMTFFHSLIPDILTLSEKRQRLYKQSLLRKLNEYLDQQEMQF